MRPSEIAALLDERGFRPKRSLGQNFLLDPGLLRAVAEAGEVGAGDFVLEVGTGAGTLTAELAGRAAGVATIEVDPRIQGVAREVIARSPAGEAGLARVRFLAGDVLHGPSGLHPEVEAALTEAARAGRRVKCVSNFPYAVATPLLVRLLERSVVDGAFPLALAAGMVQREVAERLTASSIGKDYGVPSVLVQTLGRPEILRRVSPRAFWPPPKVESAVIRIVPGFAPGAPAPAAYPRFRDLVRAVFRYRRKTLRNALLRGLELPPEAVDDALRHTAIDPEARVEQLSVEALSALAAALERTRPGAEGPRSP